MVIVVVLADQASKAWALASLPPGARAVVVIPGWLWFRLVSNSGATFSLLPGHNLLFAVATSLILIAILVLLLGRRHLTDGISVVALGAIAGGGLGNLVVRIRLGGVIDFIQVRAWPTDFNLADLAIRLGVVGFVLGLVLQGRRRRPARS